MTEGYLKSFRDSQEYLCNVMIRPEDSCSGYEFKSPSLKNYLFTSFIVYLDEIDEFKIRKT